MIPFVKNKKGLTLVELVVAMLVFSITAATTTVVLSNMLNMYSYINHRAEANALLDTLSDEIMSELSRANDVDVDDEGSNYIKIITNVNEVEYSVLPDDNVKGGYLYRDTDFLFDPKYYKGKTIKMESARSGDLVTITLTIIDRNGAEMASRDYVVRPLAMMPSY